MIRYRAAHFTITAAAAAAVLLTGCSTDTDTPPTTTTSAPVLTGIGGTDDRTPTEIASDAAIQKARDFYSVRGELDADPTIDVAKLNTVAVDPVLSGLTGDIMLRRSEGIVSSGAITVVTATATGFDIPAETGPGSVDVDACTDADTWISNYPDGRSAKDAAVRFVRSQLTVRNTDINDASGWRVASLRSESVPSC